MMYRLEREPKPSNGEDTATRPVAAAKAASADTAVGNALQPVQPVPLPPAEVRVALKRVIEQIEVELAASRHLMVTVTGSSVGEGASSIAWWMLCLLAASGAGELLYVDASVPAEAAADAPPRLAPVVPGGEDLLRRVRPGPMAGVSTLTLRGAGAAGRPLNPAELVGALEAVRERFDWVIVDAAPPAASPVSLLLAQKSDGVLLVLEAHRTDRQHAQATVDLILRAGARIIGAVLNKTRA